MTCRTLTTNCLQTDGVVQVHGLNTQQHTSWQKLCCTVSLNVAANWNSSYPADADLKKAITLCDEVISKCPLESDYNNLYAKWTGIDCKAEESNEILMSCQHTSSATGRFGNRTYNYFNPQFSNFSGGWTQRGQYIGGMDFQRCRPTEYAYAIFDNVNDSRMWKTFKTVYGLNNIASKADDGSGYKRYYSRSGSNTRQTKASSLFLIKK